MLLSIAFLASFFAIPVIDFSMSFECVLLELVPVFSCDLPV